MPNKTKALRAIDVKLPYTGGGSAVSAAGEALAPAVPVNLLAPSQLRVVSTLISYVAVTPQALANLSWRAPANGPTPVEYLVEWSLGSSFTTIGGAMRTGRALTTAAVPGPAGETVYYRVSALYAQGIQGPASASASTTLPEDTTPPAAPTSLSTSWSGVTGDLTIAWTNPTSRNLKDVRLRIYASNGGSLLREVRSTTGRYVWTFAQHHADTAGSYDTSVYLVLTAYNWSGTASATNLTGTATLSAPSAPSAPTATGGVFNVAVTLPSGAGVTFVDYEVKAFLNGSGTAASTFYARQSPLQWSPPSTGSWRFSVAGRDVFGQIGTHSSLSTSTDADSATDYVADLRSGLLYTDSAGTTEAFFDTLKDGRTDLTTTVVYASGTSWKWTQADWQQQITHQTTDLYLPIAASAYIGVSSDGSTYTWYAGGTASGGVWEPVAQASEAAAQTAATSLAIGAWRIDLPTPVQCRYIRIGHRNTTTAYGLREFFPATLLRGTYIQAESITALELSATAINGMTITGATLQTAASGERVVIDSTGLKTYDAAGTVQVEATTATDGALLAGAGAVRLDQDGVAIDARTSAPGSTPTDFVYVDASDDSIVAAIYAWKTASERTMSIRVPAESGRANKVWINAGRDSSGANANEILLSAFGATTPTADAELKLLGPVTGVDAQATLRAGANYVGVDGDGITLVGGVVVDDWTAPTLTNSWVNYDATTYSPAGYHIDPLGVVHLRGMVKSGTIGSAMFTLPTGYRPAYASYQPGICASGSATILIGAGGGVTIVSGSTTWTSIDGISFRAA